MNLWETFNKLNKLYDSKKQISEATSYPAEPPSISEKAEQSDALLEWKNAPSGKRVFLRKNISDADVQKVIKDSGMDMVKFNKIRDLFDAQAKSTIDQKLIDKEFDKLYYTRDWQNAYWNTLMEYLLGKDLNNWVVFEKEFFTDDPLKAEIFDRYEDTAYSACLKVHWLLADNGISDWRPQAEDKNKETVRVYPFDGLDAMEASDYFGEFKLTRLRLEYHYELED